MVLRSSMRERRFVALVLFLCAAALAGCVDSSTPPEVYATEPTGSDTIPVEVLVLADGDPAQPVAAVGVVLMSGGSALETATSDASGVARFWVEPPSRAHGFGILASGDGWTEERIDAAFTLGGYEEGTVRARIPVYHSLLTFQETVQWQGPVTVQMVGDRSSVTQELGFADDPAIQHAYSRRIDTLTVDIGWQNTPTVHGDFGVFIEGNREGEEDERMVRSDSDQGVGHQGQANETVTIDRSGLISLVDTRSPDAWYGIDTDEPVVAPEGVPIDVTFTATFRTPVIEVQEGPGIHILVALASVGLVLLLGRRRK